MQKRMVRLLALLLCVLLMPWAGAQELAQEAPSAILMEAATGTIIYEKQAHARLAPASVTKVMTLLLVMEALESGKISWDDTVTASDAAAGKGGSQVYLEPGEQMGMDEMLKSVVVSSANDCATALAEHIAGSEQAFVSLMNERAKELGMEDTHFVNCTGLDDEPGAEEHLTSAYDIAIMSRELLKHDDIRKYTTIWVDTIRNGEFGLSNTNKLVRFYSGTTGLKTGYTSSAGHCLAASAMRDGVEYIAVVLNCPSSGSRFQAAKELLNYGFANFTLASPDPTAEIPKVAVVLGNSDTICPRIKDQNPILIEKGKQSSIKTEVTVQEEVKAPVEEGQQLGTMLLKSNGSVLAEIPLVAPERIERKTWWDIAKELIGVMCFCQDR